MVWPPLLTSVPPWVLVPMAWQGWLLLIVEMAILIWMIWNWWEDPRQWLVRQWKITIGLAVLAAAGGFLPVFHAPWPINPIAGWPVLPQRAYLFPLCALAWMLAGGFLGPTAAGLLGLWHGLLISLYSTHTPFAALETAGLAVLFGAAMSQRYRTWMYDILRHPLGATVVHGAYFCIAMLVSAYATAQGAAVMRIDYALTQSWPAQGARLAELAGGAIVPELAYLIGVRGWRRRGNQVPSPAEVSLQARFFFRSVPMMVLILAGLAGAIWWFSQRAMRMEAQTYLSREASLAVSSLSYFLDDGRGQIQQAASALASDQSGKDLMRKIDSTPYFSQLLLLDRSGRILATYPDEQTASLGMLTANEHQALGQILAGQNNAEGFSIDADSQVTQGFFMAVAEAETGESQEILLGRVELAQNSSAVHLIGADDRLRDSGGALLLVNAEGNTVTLSGDRQPSYTAELLRGSVGMGELRDESGERIYRYIQGVEGTAWLVVLSLPQTAIPTAIFHPVWLSLGALILIVPLIFLTLGATLRGVSANIRQMSSHAARITMGEMERSIPFSGADEIGRLGEGLDALRLTLKRRLDELNRLLVVSKSVASSLEITGAIRPILAASFLGDSTSSRVVLIPQVGLEPAQKELVTLGAGPSANLFSYLDNQLFELNQEQDLVTVPNVTRMRRLIIPAGNPSPGAVAGFAIRNEGQYFGSFWVAFDARHNFTEDEIRYWRSLSEEINLAAASSCRYATAEVGRRRLASAWDLSPTPFMIFDLEDRLITANLAARSLGGFSRGDGKAGLMDPLIAEPELRRALTNLRGGILMSEEILLSDDRSYMCYVAPLKVDEVEIGRICLLHDVTRFREADQKKTEFLATAVHDLRSPLTHVRGYATMLQAMGGLNDNQAGYSSKLVAGVEQMTHIVNNLLDLGQIEGGQPLKLARFPILQMLQEAAAAMQVQASQKELTLEISCAPELAGLMIEADRSLLMKALAILLDNAVRYTPAKGHVELRMDVRPATLLLQVEDDGVGIAPLDLPRVFERFTRTGTQGLAVQRGSGLGLAIAKTIVDRHAGQIWVDSTLGKGSTFSVELPLRQASRQGEGPAAKPGRKILRRRTKQQIGY